MANVTTIPVWIHDTSEELGGVDMTLLAVHQNDYIMNILSDQEIKNCGGLETKFIIKK